MIVSVIEKKRDKISSMNKNLKIPEDQLDNLKEAFTIFDMDNDGIVPVQLLRTLLRHLGQNPFEAEILEMMKTMKKNKNSTISFNEFAALMVDKLEVNDIEDKVREAFHVFDVNGNGLVSAVELRHVVTTLGDELTEQEANEMIRKADVGDDGLINYNDFVNMMSPK